MPVDFLKKDEQIEAPIGIGFGPPSLIAQWAAGVYYNFWSEQDFPKEEYGWDIRIPTRSGTLRYYFENQAKARIAYAETDPKYPTPPMVWLWMTDTDTVLNWRSGDDKEIGDVYGPLFSRETAYKNLTKVSHRTRHELHLMSLPSAVAAMADDWGYDNPGFPIGELRGAADEILWTDSFQRDMVGNEDVGIADSILGKRRDALWKALGENDPKKWQPIGSGVAGGKYDTTSEKLHECLGILHSRWGGPIWAQVDLVWDPRVDATFGEGDDKKRLTKPVLVKIFANKAEAQAAANEEMRERGGEVTAGTPRSAAPTGGPALPSGYEKFGSHWVEAMQGLKAEHGEKMPPPPVLAGELKRLLPDHDASKAYQIIKVWWPVA